MAMTPRLQTIARRAPARVCCEFDWQSARFEIVELAQLPGPQEAGDGVARFAIDGRMYALRPKSDAHNLAMPAAPGKAPVNGLTEMLTSRERQIVELVSAGLRNKQIAARLQLSEYTVAAYVKQICHKLQVSNRTAMVSRCFQAGVQPFDRGLSS